MWRRGMVFWQLTVAKGSALLARFWVQSLGYQPVSWDGAGDDLAPALSRPAG